MLRFATLALLLNGCVPAYTPPKSSAPMLLAAHAEGSGQLWSDPKVSGGADIGFERTGCCSVGMYVSTSRLSNDAAKAAADPQRALDSEQSDDAKRALEVLDGGVELGVALPAFENRFRLRARAGLSGTPPSRPYLGRSGFSTSVMFVTRFWEATAPAANKFSPDIDVLLGYSVVSLGREHTSAGRVTVDDGYSDHALMLGLRLGADYGLDLE